MKLYNIVVNTAAEKYLILDYLRSEAIEIVDVAGYFEQYIIYFKCGEIDAETVDAEINYILSMHSQLFPLALTIGGLKCLSNIQA